MPAAVAMLFILLIVIVGFVYWLVTKARGEPGGEVHMPPPDESDERPTM